MVAYTDYLEAFALLLQTLDWFILFIGFFLTVLCFLFKLLTCLLMSSWVIPEKIAIFWFQLGNNILRFERTYFCIYQNAPNNSKFGAWTTTEHVPCSWKRGSETAGSHLNDETAIHDQEQKRAILAFMCYTAQWGYSSSKRWTRMAFMCIRWSIWFSLHPPLFGQSCLVGGNFMEQNIMGYKKNQKQLYLYKCGLCALSTCPFK